MTKTSVKKKNYFRKGKGIYGDALKYQKKIRTEWGNVFNAARDNKGKGIDIEDFLSWLE